MASFAHPNTTQTYVLLLLLPCVSDEELVEAYRDPGYVKLRYEIVTQMARRIRSGVNPARFREVQAGAVRDAIEGVSHV
jgi:hypothetical protein